jgi:hypothetical protein
MTQTLSREPSDPLFQPVADNDPATPGDPLSRLRFHYGQCLSAEDFEAEQRYFVLRQRLHNALLHGVGTVWGLAIRRQEPRPEGGDQLICEPGMAIDPLGREIWVPQPLCLDLAALEASFWAQLQPPPGAPAAPEPRDNTASNPDEPAATAPATAPPDRRRAYVVLRYEACLSDEVPVIPLPCSDDHDGLAASRLRDSFRLCLEAEAPPDPYATVRDITRRQLPAEPRQRLLRHALNDAPLPGPVAPLERFWSGADDAALLLATLDLEANGEASGEGPRLRQPVVLTPPATPARNPNNDVRAVLPAVQALADLALGIRLEGASSAATPFQVMGVTATAIDRMGEPISTGATAEAMAIEIQLSEGVLVNHDDPEATTAALTRAVQLLLWDAENSTWLEVAYSTSAVPRFEWSESSATEPAAIRFKLEPAWTASTFFQVSVKGTGTAALLSNTLRPLAGVAGEIVPPASGRDAYLFGTYTLPQREPEVP